MDKATYQEKLLFPEWIAKKRQILKRDKYTCQWCQAKGVPLHVHHLDYKDGRMPWEYEDSWLISICGECHETEHMKRPSMEKLLISYVRLAGENYTSVLTIAYFLKVLNHTGQLSTFLIDAKYDQMNQYSDIFFENDWDK